MHRFIFLALTFLGFGFASAQDATNTPPAAPTTSAPAPASPAQSVISEAFGMKLGDSFAPSTAIGKNALTDGTPMYQFTPLKAFRSFTDYFVMITPKTNKIYCIWGSGTFDNTETAKKEQSLIMQLLTDKYGATEKQGMFDAIGDIQRIDHGNRYVITKISGFTTATFDIRYYDQDLEAQAEKERIELEAKKVDAGGL